MEAQVQVEAAPPAAAVPETLESVRDRQWKAGDAAAAGVFVAILVFFLIFGPGKFEDRLLDMLISVGAAVAIDLAGDFVGRFMRKRTGGKPTQAQLERNARLHARWPRVIRKLSPDYDFYDDIRRQRHKLAFFAFGLLMLQMLIDAAEVAPQTRGQYFALMQAGVAAGVITVVWVGALGDRPGSTAIRGAIAGAAVAIGIGVIALLFRIGNLRLVLHSILLWSACGYLGGRMIERAGLTNAALRAMAGVTAAVVGLGILYWLFAWQFPWLLYLMVVAGWAAALLVYRPAAAALEPPPPSAA